MVEGLLGEIPEGSASGMKPTSLAEAWKLFTTMSTSPSDSLLSHLPVRRKARSSVPAGASACAVNRPLQPQLRKKLSEPAHSFVPQRLDRVKVGSAYSWKHGADDSDYREDGNRYQQDFRRNY